MMLQRREKRMTLQRTKDDVGNKGVRRKKRVSKLKDTIEKLHFYKLKVTKRYVKAVNK